MSIFKRSIFKEKTTRRCTDVYADMIADAEEFIDYSFAATGTSFTDLLDELDEDNAKIVKKCVDSYRSMMNRCYEQAEIIDRMEDKLDALTEQNEEMLNKINYLVSLTK